MLRHRVVRGREADDEDGQQQGGGSDRDQQRAVRRKDGPRLEEGVGQQTQSILGEYQRQPGNPAPCKRNGKEGHQRVMTDETLEQ